MHIRTLRTCIAIAMLMPLIGCATPGPSAHTEEMVGLYQKLCQGGSPYACVNEDRWRTVAAGETQQAAAQNVATANAVAAVFLSVAAAAVSEPTYVVPVYVVPYRRWR